MTSIKHSFSILFISFLLTGCASKVFEPLYKTVPVIEPLQNIAYLPERSVPLPVRSQLVINLFKETAPTKDDFYNSLEGRISKPLPSVIIGVPEEANKKNDINAKPTSQQGEIYKTDGYYNEAEQAIEAALLRKGFNVLDRSKFEAKLRDLRDRANSAKSSWYSNYDKLLENKEYDIIKQMLADDFKKGTITQKEYIDRIGEMDKLSQVGLPGEKRTEDELVDIAEVIRAAQTGEDQADYLLQINKVAISDAGDRQISFQELPEVKEFMTNNSGLRFGALPSALPPNIASKWLRVEFNAKLIGVQTGSIVWLGSYQLESWAAEPIKIIFDVQRLVDNGEKINRAIRSYNNTLRGVATEWENVTTDLKEAYQIASVRKKFDKSAELNGFKISITGKIEALKNRQKDLEIKIQTVKRDTPPELDTQWTYSYIVSEPDIQPNLSTDAASDIMGKQKLLNHRKELIRAVTQKLIKTIETGK